MTALHWASFHGRAGHVRLLVEKKADLLSRDTDGKLPLHWAAQVFNFVLFCMNNIYGLLTKLVWSRWLDITAQVLFLHVYGPRSI